MPLLIRVTSADSKKAFTRRLEDRAATIKLPRDAKLAVIDEATGQVVPVLPKALFNALTGVSAGARGDGQLVLVGEHEGEAVAIIIDAEAAPWPADTALATSEGLDAGSVPVLAEAAAGEARRGSSYELGEDIGNGGAGGVSPVVWLVFGALTIGGIALAAAGVDDDDDTPAPTPTPTPPSTDTAPPAAPSGIDLAAASDTGLRNDDDITSLTTGLVITGNAEPGATVRIFAGGTQLGGTATAAAGSGAFSFTVNLPAGANVITVTATDAAGNVSAASTPLTVTVDTTAPAAPAGLDLAAADDTGVSNSDDLTSLGSGLTITGTAPANTSVQLLSGTTLLGSGPAGATGTFSIDVALPAGASTITATALDPAGNASPASAPLTITVDNTAPAAPLALALAAADDDGSSSTDGVTDVTQDLTITGTAAAGSVVQLFGNGASLGTATADAQGNFTVTFDAPAAGPLAITATATDAAGNASAASAPLALSIGAAPMATNVSIDGNGDIITVYFDEMLDPNSLPAAGQYTLTDSNGSALATVTGAQIVGNRIQLFLATAIDEASGPVLSYTAAPGTLTDLAGNAAPSQSGAITNDLALTGTDGIAIGRTGNLTLAGAEIVAFDPASDRFFVTSGAGLQVIGVDASLNLTLLGTLALGSNDVTSVAVKNGIVAVSVVAAVKTDPGTVFLLDADAAVGPGMVLGSATVGALPDMVTFTPDGTKVLVANEGEQSNAGVTPVVNPEGSVSIIDVTNPAAPVVTTADFTAYNSQLAALQAEGVRLFAGEAGFETITVAQDVEPESISVSADGTTALITLQENNAVAVLDIASATITDIQPLGLKPFLGLPADFSDRDTGIALDTDNPVFGQFMPDAIASFTAADGQVYYIIANEGDDRDDFITPDETSRLSALTLDPAAFPDAAALQGATELGRLTVSNAPGNNGDTDGDGDIDQILTYGARSFSILDGNGNIIFDSGSHIEQFVAQGGAYDATANTGLFDDTRSDNKGPEPEGITTGVYGDSVLAFVALERGGGGVMVYDVTDPQDVEFVTYLRNVGDVSPEGLTYISAADSPTGQPVLAVSNEVSGTLSTFEITPGDTYTLQLLHFADAEAGLLAAETAPNLAALVDAFEDDYANSITLAGGDNYIPGPFYAAGADPSIASVLPGGNTQGRVDIALHNAIGVQASTIGNHEYDFGSQGFADAFRPAGTWVGAQFPYLSANLDFSGDAVLNPAFTETLGVNGLEEASSLNGRIAPSAIITENGERIGLVGVTTQLLEQISSPTGTEVKGFPGGAGANGETDNMQLLAIQLQPYIDDLLAQGVNKIILMSHLQLIGNEQALAPLLAGVDIILAAGSNTRLGDADDEAVAFPGHAADFADTYPIVTQGIDGGNTLIVNTDNEFTYLGRLVVDFDAQGDIIVANLAQNTAVNGAYAATDENVAEAYGVAPSANISVTTTSGTLSALAATQALAGNAYANFHSAAFPGGEVRGQLVLAQDNRDSSGDGTLVFTVTLAGADEVPPVSTSAFGSGRIVVLADAGAFTYDSEYTIYNLAQANLVGGHIHIGAPGANGPVEEDILNDPGTVVSTVDYNLEDTAFADGTRGDAVQTLTEAVQNVIDVKSSNVFGYSDVYLEGARAAVRNQETNLGNLTADANADAAKDALGLTATDYLVSLKNGGGIRAQIGTVSGTGSDVVFGPNPGSEVTQLDVENSLRFNNALMVFDTTPQGLLNILNNPAATTPNNGGFLQIGGLMISYDPDLAAGSRIRDVALVNEAGQKVAVVDDGVVVAGAPATITMVALNFTANGGDGYPVKANGSNFRFLLDDGTVSAQVDPALNFTATGVVPANVLGEQGAFEEYLSENFGSPALAFDEAETPAALDLRIQNQNLRVDTVLDPASIAAAPADGPAMAVPMPAEVFA